MAERRRTWIGPVSICGCALVTALYAAQPDQLYAAFVYPAWLYTAAALLILAAFRPKPFWRTIRIPLACWALFTIFFAEPSFTLFRRKPGSFATGEIRLVSLNCAGGNPLAATEGLSEAPDLALLQESPTRSELIKVATERYGSGVQVVIGPDAALVSRFPLEPVPLPKGTNDFVAAIWTAPSGQKFFVVSLRLVPPALRFDYFSPDCWAEYTKNLQIREHELEEISRFIQDHRGSYEVIVAGDFNAAPVRAIQDRLPSGLVDAFRSAGRGWPYSAVNEGPLVRIDQVYLSQGLEPTDGVILQTKESDHRMVVIDFKPRAATP